MMSSSSRLLFVEFDVGLFLDFVVRQVVRLELLGYFVSVSSWSAIAAGA